jgi:hypothetical protein
MDLFLIHNDKVSQQMYPNVYSLKQVYIVNISMQLFLIQ